MVGTFTTQPNSIIFRESEVIVKWNEYIADLISTWDDGDYSEYDIIMLDELIADLKAFNMLVNFSSYTVDIWLWDNEDISIEWYSPRYEETGINELKVVDGIIYMLSDGINCRYITYPSILLFAMKILKRIL